MPRFSIEDVDRQIEEVRARHKKVGNELITKFRDITKKRKAGVPPVRIQEV